PVSAKIQCKASTTRYGAPVMIPRGSNTTPSKFASDSCRLAKRLSAPIPSAHRLLIAPLWTSIRSPPLTLPSPPRGEGLLFSPSPLGGEGRVRGDSSSTSQFSPLPPRYINRPRPSNTQRLAL